MRTPRLRYILLAYASLGLAHAQSQQGAPSNIPSQTGSTAGQIYRQAAPSVVSIEAYDEKGQVRWTGTGFIVAADGKILTNYHVIRNSKEATVRLANGDAYDGVEVMDIDRRKDIALLKIKAVELQPIRIGSSNNSQVGDQSIRLVILAGWTIACQKVSSAVSARGMVTA